MPGCLRFFSLPVTALSSLFAKMGLLHSKECYQNQADHVTFSIVKITSATKYSKIFITTATDHSYMQVMSCNVKTFDNIPQQQQYYWLLDF